MTIAIDLFASSMPEEACTFTLWLPVESANKTQQQRALDDAEQIMTGMPAQILDAPAPVAATFLGQWL